jgi:hypothetical protein
MKRALLAALLAALLMPQIQGGEAVERTPTVRTRPHLSPTLTISPRNCPVGQVCLIRGQGWEPGEVQLAYNQGCPPGEVCPVSRLIKRVKVGPSGSFVFHLEHVIGGPSSCNMDGVGMPGAVGVGPVEARQVKRRGGIVHRTVLDLSK